MNRPEGISESAWEKAVDLVMNAEAERVPYYSTSEEIRDARLADATAIAKAIQSSVEAERAKAIKFASAGMIREGKDDWAKGYRCAAADILDAIKGA